MKEISKVEFIVKRLSRRKSHEMILLMARNMSCSHSVFTADQSIKDFFNRAGYIYENIVEECRDFNKNIPLVENLISSSGWRTVGNPKVELVNNETGEELELIHGNGLVDLSIYDSKFNQSIKMFNSSIEKIDYQDFLSACTYGVASIEAYINYRAGIFNSRQQKEEDKLLDNAASRVSLEDKIDKWIPCMLLGLKLEKGYKDWKSFQRLKTIRDTCDIHPHQPGEGKTYDQLCELINIFSDAFPVLLIKLHNLFKELIPSKIIRYSFFPGVEIKTNNLAT